MNEAYRRLLQAVVQACQETKDHETQKFLTAALQCFVREKVAYVRQTREESVHG